MTGGQAGGRGRRHLHRPARVDRSAGGARAGGPDARCVRWRSASTTARPTNAAPPFTGGRTTAPTAPTAACTAAARSSTGCSGTSPAATPAAPRPAMRERQSVLDAVVADAQQAEPGPGPRRSGRAWTSTWRRCASLERRITAGGRWCARRRRPPEDELSGPSLGVDYEPRGPLVNKTMAELLALALSCDLTRVFTYQLAKPGLAHGRGLDRLRPLPRHHPQRAGRSAQVHRHHQDVHARAAGAGRRRCARSPRATAPCWTTAGSWPRPTARRRRSTAARTSPCWCSAAPAAGSAPGCTCGARAREGETPAWCRSAWPGRPGPRSPSSARATGRLTQGLEAMEVVVHRPLSRVRSRAVRPQPRAGGASEDWSVGMDHKPGRRRPAQGPGDRRRPGRRRRAVARPAGLPVRPAQQRPPRDLPEPGLALRIRPSGLIGIRTCPLTPGGAARAGRLMCGEWRRRACGRRLRAWPGRRPGRRARTAGRRNGRPAGRSRPRRC